MSPQPGMLGAVASEQGVDFCVWVQGAGRVELYLKMKKGGEHRRLMGPAGRGVYSARVENASAGDRYGYILDDQGPMPDPASRYQPDGVHELSEVVDAGSFHWTDSAWGGVVLDRLVLYELHVGTFSKRGDFTGVIERLSELKALGVGAIELMPVADFSGNHNWGYDGAALFAPARCYGRPEDLRRLVDSAHAIGLGVLLDVVYNHLGPDGAYLSRFSPAFFSDVHHTPWGAAVNLDGEGSFMTRRFLIENALHWIREYHMDGLRLDATHALIDEGPRHFLDELREAVRRDRGARPPALVIAEDDRNLARLVQPAEAGGYGLDAVWADDLHHQFRVFLTGDRDGYFHDFSGSAADLAQTLETGWWYKGQHSTCRGAPRGTDPGGVPHSRFVVCLQNHDQVGNRALGDRLHHAVDLAAFHAASALLLCAPETPLLFMGQEWAASSPFQYFTDHAGVLAEQVRAGRRKEFAGFSSFADPRECGKIPDPQDESTFEQSRLHWEERASEPHASTLRLYQALLQLRLSNPALGASRKARCIARGIGEDSVVLVRRNPEALAAVCVIARLRGEGALCVDAELLGDAAQWRLLLSTEDSAYAVDPVAAVIGRSSEGLEVLFGRPGAVILES